MTFANPLGLALAGLALPVLLLHILRPRRRAVTVSSTFLWRSLPRPVSSAKPWQKLRWSLLLLAQLLIVAVLAIVVARPVRLEAAALAEHTVFIVDTSASMAATDVSENRVRAAAERAIALRTELPAGGVASIVVAGDRPRVILTESDDESEFAASLRALEPTQSHPDFAGTFALAESLDTAASDIGFVFLSDGGVSDDEAKLLPPGTRYERIGQSSTNRTITRLSVEPRGSGLHARVTVRNAGGPAAKQLLTVDVDGERVATQDIAVRTDATDEFEFDIPLGDRVVAHLEGGDALALDDEAFAVAGRRPDLKVLLVGDRLFWQELLTSIPGVTVDALDAASNGDGYDVVIYNGVDVPADVAAPFIAVAPPAGLPGVTVSGAVDRPAVTLLRADDPLLSGIDLADVAIAFAQRITTTSDVLVAGESAPLIVRGTAYEQQFVYVAFALRDSNLPVQLAFPILGDRVLGELSGAGQAVASLDVGADVPVASDATGEVIGPDNTRRGYSPGSPFVAANRRGFWTVTEDGKPDRVVAVNAPDDESNIEPRASLTAPAAVGERPSHPARQEHSLLAWFVWPLLVLLALEAWLAWRGLGVGRVQWSLAIAARMGVAALLIATLFAPALRRSSDRVATVFLLDASASMGASGDRAALTWIRDALADRDDEDLAAVVAFGGDARVDRVLEASSEFDGRAVVVDDSATDIAAALRLGSALLPSDAKRRIVVISDGRVTAGDVRDEAAQLGQGDVPVDVHTITSAQTDDAAVSAIDVPSLARVGDAIQIDVTVSATRASAASVTLRRDGVDVETLVVDLVPGDNRVTFTDEAGTDAGAVMRYQAVVQSAGDAQPNNDAAFAAVPVDGPARVLVVEGTRGEARDLIAALEAGGVGSERVTPADVPDVQKLATYAGIVFVDVDAAALSTDAIQAVTSAVRDLGRGLVTIGGDRSYGVGGYRESALSDVLPVDSEILDPKRRKTVAEVLSIDTSGSMAACHCAGDRNTMGAIQEGGINKTDISRAAAERTIAALTDNDQIGVLAWNSSADWVIDLQTLPPQDVIDTGLGSLRPDGMTNLRASLQEAADALLSSSAELKHIILFTDGFTDPQIIEEIADQAGEIYDDHGITTSVLATGEGAAPLLEDIAIAGHGRFHAGTDLDKVPQIMAQEAVIASRDFINEGSFLPEVTSTDEVVQNLTSSPPLLGYVATTAKPGAATLLRIGPDRDPLLATWQAGLGTVTSWTSDASQRWAQDWAGWDGYTDFWSRVVKDTFQSGDTAGAVRAHIQDGHLQLTVEGTGSFPDGSTGTAVVAGPDGQRYEVPLERVDATTFTASLPATRSGTYAVGVDVESAGETVLASSTLASESYPAEYEPGSSDTAAMAELSRLAGGRGEIAAAQAFDPSGLVAGARRVPLTAALLFAAALLWPIAVTLSRLSLRGATVAGAKLGLGRAGRRVKSAIPSIARDPVNAPAPARRAEVPSPAPTAAAATTTSPNGASAKPTAGRQTAAVNDLLARKRQRQAQGRDPSPDSSGDDRSG